MGKLLVGLVLGLSLPAAAQEMQPPGPPPSEVPTLEAPPPPPDAESATPDQAPDASAPDSQGQWVYTSQYGWVWMPYGEVYSYFPAAGVPSAYVYGPVLGWSWVHAPWIYGWGPRPYWGALGLGRFFWHARPFYPVTSPFYPTTRHVFRGGGHPRGGAVHGHR